MATIEASTAMMPVRPQLARNRRTDDLDAALRVVGAERVDDLLHRHLLLGVAARLLLDADQHVGVGAEALDLHVADAELVELRRASSARSAGPLLCCTSISEPPLKSTP